MCKVVVGIHVRILKALRHLEKSGCGVCVGNGRKTTRLGIFPVPLLAPVR